MPMLPVSAAELASIQADAAAAACDQACTIKRLVRTPEAQGGATTTLTTVSPNGLLAGMAEPTAGQLTNYGYLIGSLAAWQVKFPVSTSVQEQDQLFIAGQQLNVVKILSPRSYPGLLTVLATEVK